MTAFRISFVAAALAVSLLAVAGCGGKPIAEAVQEMKVPAIPILKRDNPPGVRPLREVDLLPGGEASALAVIDRNGNDGPIKAEVKNLPPGITAVVEPAVDVDSLAKLTIKLAADATLGDAPVDGTADVDVVVNERPAKQRLRVRVPQVCRPEVCSQPPFVIQPGTTAVWRVPIERHGFEGEIEFQAVSSRDSMTVQATPIPAGESELSLQVEVEPDAVEGEMQCSLEWMSYGRVLRAELPVAVVRQPFSLPAVVPVTLSRGQQRQVSLGVSRAAHEGAVSVVIGPLPEGVKADPAEVVLESDSAGVEFSADESAAEGVAFVPVEASAGHLTAAGLLAVRVSGDTDPDRLPTAVIEALQSKRRRTPVDARRSTEARQAMADFYGTTQQCERSVRKSLEWLASVQEQGGAWQAQGAGASPSAPHSQVARTALAVLPFLAEGIAPKKEAEEPASAEGFAGVVEKAVSSIKDSQPEDGERKGAIGDCMESHLLGLIALSEAYAITAADHGKDAKDLRARAELAVDRLDEFAADGGGWEVENGNQARDTALAVVALQAARACGSLPSSSLRKAEKWLQRFFPTSGLHADAELTATCLLAIQGTKSERDAPEIAAGCDYLRSLAPDVGAEKVSGSPLFLVFATEALRNLEGEQYDAWNASVRTFLTLQQVQDGPLAGSWDPAIFAGEADRVWATACATLCLQSHFRNLPLYRSAKAVKPAGE